MNRRSRESKLSEKADGGAVRVVSGGQTGVDRAALDAALQLGLPIGGWCPSGRRAEDGRIPGCYGLDETPARHYAERTEWNVRDSDATLILHRGDLTGGTSLTAKLARRYGRPLLVRDVTVPLDVAEAVAWLRRHRVGRLNCAGPRESGAPGIYRQAKALFIELFAAWARSRP